MSMIYCDDCGRLIDSDDDPECFICAPHWAPVKVQEEVLCERCRDVRIDQQMLFDMENT